MQNQANKQYNGSMEKEMRDVNRINAPMSVDAARASWKAFKSQDKIKDFDQWITMNEATHWEAVTGQNLATRNQANMFNKGVTDTTEFDRTQHLKKSLAESLAIAKVPQNQLVRSEDNAMAYNIAHNIGLGTRNDAYNTGLWGGQHQTASYESNKALYQNPATQAAVESLGAMYTRVISPEIPSAIVSKSKAITKSVNGDVANFLETAKREGVFSRAALWESKGVTDAAMRVVDAKYGRKLENSNQRLMSTDVNGKASVHASEETPTLAKALFGFNIGAKGEASVGANSRVNDMLNNNKSLDSSLDILRKGMNQKFLQIAESDPDNAFTKQKALFTQVEGALKSGDMQKALDMVGMGGLSQASTSGIKQSFTNNSNIAVQVQEHLNDMGNSVDSYLSGLNRITKQVFGDKYTNPLNGGGPHGNSGSGSGQMITAKEVGVSPSAKAAVTDQTIENAFNGNSVGGGTSSSGAGPGGSKTPNFLNEKAIDKAIDGGIVDSRNADNKK